MRRSEPLKKEPVMILDLSTFAWIHTVLSLVALISGIVVVIELLGSRLPGTWTTVYLASAVATSATGFGFQGVSFGASHWVGVMSLVALAAAILAHYVFHFVGAWRWLYAVSIVLGLYLLVFVAIAQAFKKVPALRAMAPTLSELPFAYAQVVALVPFVALVIAAARIFRPDATMVTPSR
jgi:hypothetical protein